MLLPLPRLYVLILNACVRGEWRANEYEGSALAGKNTYHYTGILAIRGDVRIQIEWECLTIGGVAAGPWDRRLAEAAVRAPEHDPADWRLPWPRRWWFPASRDEQRRCPVSGVYAAVRLLSYPDEALRAAVLEGCASRMLAAQR